MVPDKLREPEVTHHDIYYQLGEITQAINSVDKQVQQNRDAITTQNTKLDHIEDCITKRLDSAEKDIIKIKTWWSAIVAIIGVLAPIVWWVISKHLII